MKKRCLLLFIIVSIQATYASTRLIDQLPGKRVKGKHTRKVMTIHDFAIIDRERSINAEKKIAQEWYKYYEKSQEKLKKWEEEWDEYFKKSDEKLEEEHAKRMKALEQDYQKSQEWQSDLNNEITAFYNNKDLEEEGWGFGKPVKEVKKDHQKIYEKLKEEYDKHVKALQQENKERKKWSRKINQDRIEIKRVQKDIQKRQKEYEQCMKALQKDFQKMFKEREKINKDIQKREEEHEKCMQALNKECQKLQDLQNNVSNQVIESYKQKQVLQEILLQLSKNNNEATKKPPQSNPIWSTLCTIGGGFGIMLYNCCRKRRA